MIDTHDALSGSSTQEPMAMMQKGMIPLDAAETGSA